MKNIFYTLSLFLAFACTQNTQPTASPTSPAKKTTSTEINSETTWELASIDNQMISTSDKAPNLKFDTATKQVSGFGGCNRLSGSFNLVGSQISFEPMVATKMLCAGNTIEDRFLSRINLKTFEYTATANTLVLKNAEGVLSFKAVE